MLNCSDFLYEITATSSFWIIFGKDVVFEKKNLVFRLCGQNGAKWA